MKPHRTTTTARRSATLILAGSILALLGSGAAQAGNQTWTGGSVVNTNWSNNANWTNSSPPGSTSVTTNQDIATFNTITTRGSTSDPVIIDANRNILGIVFDGSADGVGIGTTSGNALRLSTPGGISVLSSNTGSGIFQIDAPLLLVGSATFTNSGSQNPTLNITNTVSCLATTSYSLTLSGSATGTYNSPAGNSVSGNISNGNATVFSLSKSGAGLWQLQGNNTYTGGTTISGGTLLADTPTALGSGGVTFTGSSTLGVLPLGSGGSGTIANDVGINSGVTATFQGSGNTSVLGGVISGSGNVTVDGVTLGNANTYTGGTTVSGGIVTIGTIGDIGTATPNSLGKASGGIATIQLAGALLYSGSTLGSSNRVVNLTTAVTGTTAFLYANGTVTFALSGGVTSSGTSGISTLQFDGTTAGSESGVISNGTGTNVTAIAKRGTGTWTLSGANTYSGTTLVNNGTLAISTIGNAGGATPNALGTPSGANATILLGNSAGATSTLRYIGSTLGSSDRLITLTNTTGGSFFLEASGSIPFTLSGGITSLGSSGTSLLTLGGTSVGSESGVIAKGTGSNVTALTKAGPGTWTLSAAETYTGATTVSGGELFVNGSIAGSAATVSGTGSALGGMGTVGSVSVGSGAILEGGAGSPTGALTSGGNVSLLDGSSIELTLGGSLTHSTLARTGGTWAFDSNQAFTFNIGGGATGGFYDNIITGLTGSEAGLSTINTWTIDPALGMTGTFTNDGAGHIDLNVSTIPEPSSGVALVGGLLLLGLRRRRARA